jgi:hypothetical protein
MGKEMRAGKGNKVDVEHTNGAVAKKSKQW